MSQNNIKKINVFDTTLRDGAQAAKRTAGLQERIAFLNAFKRLMNRGTVEAGFAISNDTDFQTIQKAGDIFRGTDIEVATLCRAMEGDINRGWQAVQNADNPVIHTFVSTSPIHMEKKLEKSPDEVLEMARQGVRHAKNVMGGRGAVEFSAEDATRTDMDFMEKIVRIAIEEGATRINLPDTVGYAQVGELSNMFNEIQRRVPEISEQGIILSCHNHNDLGLATANSLDVIRNAGVTQFEGTINGVGERAGNSALEELMFNMGVRPDVYSNFDLGIRDPKEVGNISYIVSEMLGMPVQYNKAVVGAHAFAHMSGIHQHGAAKAKETYELANPDDWGWVGDNFGINSNSGRKGYQTILENFGLNPSSTELDKIVKQGEDYCQKYGSMDSRVAVCMLESLRQNGDSSRILVNSYNIQSGSDKDNLNPVSTMDLMVNGRRERITVDDMPGSVSSVYAGLERIMEVDTPKMTSFDIKSVGNQGTKSMGETLITLSDGDREVYGHGLHQDIVQSALQAYVSALNKF